MTELTPRFRWPLLAAGQAQKELYHNEALTAIEVLVQPVAESLGDNDPPTSPTLGRSWIVGSAPTGAWTGQAGAVASWTAGGWRFTVPVDGMAFWIADESLWAQRESGSWQLGVVSAASLAIDGNQVVGSREAAIADPVGGATTDAAARSAIAAILAALRSHGLIAS